MDLNDSISGMDDWLEPRAMLRNVEHRKVKLNCDVMSW